MKLMAAPAQVVIWLRNDVEVEWGGKNEQRIQEAMSVVSGKGKDDDEEAHRPTAGIYRHQHAALQKRELRGGVQRMVILRGDRGEQRTFD